MLTFSPDSRHLAYVGLTEDKASHRLFVDHRPLGPAFPIRTCETMFISPDSEHIAVYINERDHDYMIRDGIREAPYYAIEAESILFSAAGRLGYRARKNGLWVAVVDGVESNACQRVIGPVFSPDGKRVAYASCNPDSCIVTVDGQAGYEYESAYGLCFTPDSEHFMHISCKNKEHHLIIDGRVAVSYASIPNPPVFSPDGKHYAYVGIQHNESFVMLDGVRQANFNVSDWRGKLIFSPDSEHLGYLIKLKGKLHMVVDGEISPGYDRIFNQTPQFALSGVLMFLAERDGELYRTTWDPARACGQKRKK